MTTFLLLLNAATAADCPSTTWTQTCYTLIDNAETVYLAAFDPGGGEVCAITPTVDAEIGPVGALVVIETDAWFCANHLLTSLSLTTGVLAPGDVECSGVASDGTNLLVIDSASPLGSVYSSPSEVSVDAARPESSFSMLGGSRAATDGTFWYSTTPGGVGVRRHDIAEGGIFAGTLAFDGFDGVVWGLALLDGNFLVLDDGRSAASDTWSTPSVRAFDATTGKAGTVTPLSLRGASARGLWCTGS